MKDWKSVWKSQESLSVGFSCVCVCVCDWSAVAGIFFQLLAMLFKKKRPLLNSHILHLTFSLVGTVDSGHETSIIPNSTAFQDLLCDFEVCIETVTGNT